MCKLCKNIFYYLFISTCHSLNIRFLSFPDFLDSTNFTLNSFNGSAWTKTKGTVNYPITMDTQPAQQQGDIKFHNYLVSFIKFNTINEKKGGKKTRLKKLRNIKRKNGVKLKSKVKHFGKV